MIAERIPGNSDPGIEVPHRGIGCEHVAHLLELSERRVDQSLELHVRGGIGPELIAYAEV